MLDTLKGIQSYSGQLLVEPWGILRADKPCSASYLVTACKSQFLPQECNIKTKCIKKTNA